MKIIVIDGPIRQTKGNLAAQLRELPIHGELMVARSAASIVRSAAKVRKALPSRHFTVTLASNKTLEPVNRITRVS